MAQQALPRGDAGAAALLRRDMAEAAAAMDVLGKSNGVGAAAVDTKGETNIRRGVMGRAATGGGHQDGQDCDLLLVRLTWLGLCVGLMDAFLLPPLPLVQGTLLLAYLAGWARLGLVALRELFARVAAILIC